MYVNNNLTKYVVSEELTTKLKCLQSNSAQHKGDRLTHLQIHK